MQDKVGPRFADLGRMVVTGASGLLGANLALDIARNGAQVVAIYKDHPLRLPRRQQSTPCDLTDQARTADLFRELDPNWIVHAAALTNVDWCETHPEETMRVNVEATRNVALAARRAHARLLYVSTDSVFDGTRGNYAESDPPEPVNLYAKSKLLGEAILAEELPDCLVVRTNIYGWNFQPKMSLAEWILSRLESGVEVPGFRDVIFSPILVNDLGDRLLRMMELELAGLYHVAGSQACSKYDFAVALAKTFGLDPGLVRPSTLEAIGLAAPRPRNTSLQVAKAGQALGGGLPDVYSGLRRMKSLRENGFVEQLRTAGRGLANAFV